MILPESIMLVDKPKGITSFEVIRRLRKKFGINKIGHAGTLDPLASGLLIVGVGAGTKKLSEYVGLSKVYEAEILLGTKTDTGDVTGTVIATASVRNLSENGVKKVLENMVGEITLPVPLYSAVKQKGKALYKYAREGKSVTIPKSVMQIEMIELLSIAEDTLMIRVGVSSGTYIRSLAEELGRRLGTLGTLKNLRRISIGTFLVENSVKI